MRSQQPSMGMTEIASRFNGWDKNAKRLRAVGTRLAPSFVAYLRGCKGDRMPMYRALAPFLLTVRGDRRVTKRNTFARLSVKLCHFFRAISNN